MHYELRYEKKDTSGIWHMKIHFYSDKQCVRDEAINLKGSMNHAHIQIFESKEISIFEQNIIDAETEG